MKGIKGYKAFNSNMTCRDMQYEIGKEYKMDEKPVLCKTGFHFCKSIADCYEFYLANENTIICEIRALGEVVTDDDKIKFCTNHILIGKKVSNPREKSNTSVSSSGYCNSGCWNSGDWNSGKGNSGSCNTGDWNNGDYNVGGWNSGDWNVGDRNSGSCNTGDWNSGRWSSGVFCTKKDPKIKMFDKESDWTMDDWTRSKAKFILDNCPFSHSEFINSYEMTKEEKEQHPEHKTIGGYIKTIVVTDEDKQKWWDSLSDEDKNIIYELPNFNARIFKECTGITV